MEIIDFSKQNIKKIIEVTASQKLFLLGIDSGSIDIELRILASNIEVDLYGIVSLNGQKEVSIKTTSNHLAPSSLSRIHIKSVLMDDSSFNFDGIIKIANGSALSDAYLQNDNLMVGDGSSVNSLPKLEILADDVKASHGVTISSFDEEQLYYLLSRGIARDKAEKVLCSGFLNEIVQKAGKEELMNSKVLEFLYENI